MIVEVVELPEELSATWVVAFQNLQASVCHRVAVFEDAKVFCIRSHQALTLVLALHRSSLVNKDIVQLVISKILTPMKH